MISGLVVETWLCDVHKSLLGSASVPGTCPAHGASLARRIEPLLVACNQQPNQAFRGRVTNVIFRLHPTICLLLEGLMSPPNRREYFSSDVLVVAKTPADLLYSEPSLHVTRPALRTRAALRQDLVVLCVLFLAVI